MKKKKKRKKISKKQKKMPLQATAVSDFRLRGDKIILDKLAPIASVKSAIASKKYLVEKSGLEFDDEQNVALFEYLCHKYPQPCAVIVARLFQAAMASSQHAPVITILLVLLFYWNPLGQRRPSFIHSATLFGTGGVAVHNPIHSCPTLPIDRFCISCVMYSSSPYWIHIAVASAGRLLFLTAAALLLLVLYLRPGVEVKPKISHNFTRQVKSSNKIGFVESSNSIQGLVRMIDTVFLSSALLVVFLYTHHTQTGLSSFEVRGDALWDWGLAAIVVTFFVSAVVSALWSRWFPQNTSSALFCRSRLMYRETVQKLIVNTNFGHPLIVVWFAILLKRDWAAVCAFGVMTFVTFCIAFFVEPSCAGFILQKKSVIGAVLNNKHEFFTNQFEIEV